MMARLGMEGNILREDPEAAHAVPSILRRDKNETSEERSQSMKTQRRKKRVIDEDVYVNEMKAIIDRDFFPTVASAQALPMKLNEYSARFTSEDNASFEDLLEEDRRRHVSKHWWSYDQKRLDDINMKPSISIKHAPRNGFLFSPPAVSQISKKDETLLEAKNPFCARQVEPALPSLVHSATRFHTSSAADDFNDDKASFPALSEISSLHGDESYSFVPMSPIIVPGGTLHQAGISPLCTKKSRRSSDTATAETPKPLREDLARIIANRRAASFSSAAAARRRRYLQRSNDKTRFDSALRASYTPRSLGRGGSSRKQKNFTTSSIRSRNLNKSRLTADA